MAAAPLTVLTASGQSANSGGSDQSQASIAVQLTGTFSATVQFEVSMDGGVTYVSISGTPVASTTTVTSATAPGMWQFDVSGLILFRVRCSAYTSGSINVYIQPCVY